MRTVQEHVRILGVNVDLGVRIFLAQAPHHRRRVDHVAERAAAPDQDARHDDPRAAARSAEPHLA
jgi:hypothetical protein